MEKALNSTVGIKDAAMNVKIIRIKIKMSERNFFCQWRTKNAQKKEKLNKHEMKKKNQVMEREREKERKGEKGEVDSSSLSASMGKVDKKQQQK